MSDQVMHESLPDVEVLKGRLNILAALGIIMSSEDEAWLRVHSKVADPEGLLCAYRVDNGAGDVMFVVFADEGCIIKGFDHESYLSPYARDEYEVWPGVYDEVPQGLLSLLDDPAFEKDDATFCVWCERDDAVWKQGAVEAEDAEDGDDGGFEFLLGLLFPTAEDYVVWAQDYYEEELPVQAIECVYAGATIDEAAIASINPERDAPAALREIQALG